MVANEFLLRLLMQFLVLKQRTNIFKRLATLWLEACILFVAQLILKGGYQIILEDSGICKGECLVITILNWVVQSAKYKMLSIKLYQIVGTSEPDIVLSLKVNEVILRSFSDLMGRIDCWERLFDFLNVISSRPKLKSKSALMKIKSVYQGVFSFKQVFLLLLDHLIQYCVGSILW